MSNDILGSSDSVRSGTPLRSADYVTFRDPIQLELGGELPEVTVCFETYGELDADAGNAVLVCHALSGDSHVARHAHDDAPGWWDIAVGPGKPIDTSKRFVICPNILGGCRGTTGPNSINPDSGKPYGQYFPDITIGDIVDVQRRLLQHLGVERLLAVIGGSMGGHQVLCWATKYPEHVREAIAIATSARMSSQALAFDIVGRNAILHDPNFAGGQYYDRASPPNVGLAIARMIGHITYLSREAMQDKFEADRYQPLDVPTSFEKHFSVGSYLGYQGDKFVERFDANSYIAITKAMDLFDLGNNQEELVRALAPSLCRWLVISFTSDWLFPSYQSQDIVDALLAAGKPVNYCDVTSSCGHDAFLLEDDLDTYGELVRAFLDNPAGGCCCTTSGRLPDSAMDGDEVSDLSIFKRDRLDYSRILDLIPPGASVLDLGCGHGRLLCQLRLRGHRHLMGVELDQEAILACVRNGQDVIHADLNRNLSQFVDQQFDVVLLSLTLQAVLDVEGVLAEMLRIGRIGIVSFPNFAYRKLRDMLAKEGRAPESTGLLRYKWYNTPNLRFLSIRDFQDLCREKDIPVLKMLALDTEAHEDVTDDPNLNADLAIVVIGEAG